MGLLSVPRTNLRTFGDTTFSVAAPTFWYFLPYDLPNATSLDGALGWASQNSPLQQNPQPLASLTSSYSCVKHPWVS